MKTQSTADMDSLLGRSDERYFGDIFRSFYMHIRSFEIDGDSVYGELQTSYIDPARPHGESAHLGSIEYLALTLRLATHGLNRLARINIADTNRAFLRSYKIILAQSLYTGIHTFKCRMLRSEQNRTSMQGSISLFEITIDNIRSVIEVDHRGGMRYGRLPADETISDTIEQLHSIGYKHTTLEIKDILVDTNHLEASAKVFNKYLFEENCLHGIGSARDALLPTDATRIFGQLMQALLYTLEGTDRHSCPNIWLRRMELYTQRSLFTGQAAAHIHFDRIRHVKTGNQHWKAVKLSGTVGNFMGSFEVAHKLS